MLRLDRGHLRFHARDRLIHLAALGIGRGLVAGQPRAFPLEALEALPELAEIRLLAPHLHVQRLIFRQVRLRHRVRIPHRLRAVDARPREFEAALVLLADRVRQEAGVHGLGPLDVGAKSVAVLVVPGEDVLLEAVLELRVHRRGRGLRAQVHAVRQIVDQARERPGDGEAEELQHDENRRAPVDFQGLDDRGRHASQVEQCESERWGQERGLDVQTHHDPEPHRGDVRARIRQQDGGDDGDDDDRDLDEVEEESEQENHRHDHDELRPEPPGHAGELLAHQILAAEGAERGGQHGGADQDDEDHRGGLRGLDHHALEGVLDGM